MIDEKLTALVGSVLLLAVTMPLAVAHTSSADPDVSGRYYGSASAYIDAPTLFPSGPSTYAAMLCDREVLDDGTAHSLLDEEDVDGHPTGGRVPDGTFDDGGVGGACHTSDRYVHSDYNTPGCEGQVSASDLVSGGDVWIGATCDWITDGSTGGLPVCLVEEIITGANTIGTTACVTTWLVPPFRLCGSDGVPDSFDYELGSTGADFISGAAFDNCNFVYDVSAAVYIFEYVEEDSFGGLPRAMVATAGTIWQ